MALALIPEEHYVLDGQQDVLYLASLAGAPAVVIDVDFDFGAVGLAFEPVLEQLFACTDGLLLELDPETGTTTPVADLGHPCNNLTAMHEPLQCD